MDSMIKIRKIAKITKFVVVILVLIQLVDIALRTSVNIQNYLADVVYYKSSIFMSCWDIISVIINSAVLLQIVKLAKMYEAAETPFDSRIAVKLRSTGIMFAVVPNALIVLYYIVSYASVMLDGGIVTSMYIDLGSIDEYAIIAGVVLILFSYVYSYAAQYNEESPIIETEDEPEII